MKGIFKWSLEAGAVSCAVRFHSSRSKVPPLVVSDALSIRDVPFLQKNGSRVHRRCKRSGQHSNRRGGCRGRMAYVGVYTAIFELADRHSRKG